jgi:glycosyltransferase involved in cell wall biosynthesis
VISVCYIDAGIRDNAGHHTNACRHFVGEFRRRGIAVYPFGNHDLDVRLGVELRVKPLFRHYPYNRLRGGPYLSYLVERASFLFDLRTAWRRGPYDIVFVHSVMSAQLAAIALWQRDLNPKEMPLVVIGFDLPTGRKLDAALEGEKRYQWNYHTRFYPKAAKLFRKKYLARTVFFTFDPVITSDYAEMLNLPVQTMPTVHVGAKEPRLRGRDRFGLINVAFLGYQRPEKGYHLIPDVVRGLFERQVPVKILIHNSAPGDNPISKELRALAGTQRNVVLIEEPGDQSRWQDLLDGADLVVLPYEPSRYRESGSGVATEAVSSGIPMVVPFGTTMETLAMNYQGCATTFSHWRTKDVTDAIERAVLGFENLAREAEAGALVWRRKNGAEVFVDRLLELGIADSRLPDTKYPDQTTCNFLVGKVLDRLVSQLT